MPPEGTTDGSDSPNPEGRPVEYELDDFLAVFTESDTFEPFAAGEVAERVGCSDRTALNKLNELVDAGALRSKSMGPRSRVFWLPPNQN